MFADEKYTLFYSIENNLSTLYLEVINISALDSTLSAFSPPIINTLPLVSKVSVWRQRAWFIDPVAENFAVEILYISAD
jgi:hypothetical protein